MPNKNQVGSGFDMLHFGIQLCYSSCFLKYMYCFTFCRYDNSRDPRKLRACCEWFNQAFLPTRKRGEFPNIDISVSLLCHPIKHWQCTGQLMLLSLQNVGRLIVCAISVESLASDCLNIEETYIIIKSKQLCSGGERLLFSLNFSVRCQGCCDCEG